MSNNLELSRRLFSVYSPLKTNQKLLNDYFNITNKTSEIDNIRSLINNIIKINYINESVVKSSFIKYFLKTKSPKKNIFIYELNVGSSRADLCVINGSSTVYEIKTEFDTYERLDKQINDYKNYFDYLNVIVPENEKYNILKNIDDTVGVIYYYINRLGNITFKTLRNSTLNNKICPVNQLESLTKEELSYLSNNINIEKNIQINLLIKKYIPKTINTLYKETIKNRFRERWSFLSNNLEKIYLLDYQWFYNNNIPYSLIYK